MSLLNTLNSDHLSNLTKVILPTQKKLMELSGQDFSNPSTLDNYNNTFLPLEHEKLRAAILEVETKWSEGCLGEEGVEELSALFTPVLECICDCISIYTGIRLLTTKKVIDMGWLDDSVYACSLLSMSAIGDDQRGAGITFRHIRSLLPRLIEECLREVADSNISKIGTDGKISLLDGKWVKPDTFRKPELTPIIRTFLERCRSATSVNSISNSTNE